MTIPQLGFLDRVIFSASSSGAGPFVFSSVVTGFQSPLAAAAVDGQLYGYAAQSGDLTQWEYGYGTWTQATQTLTRTVLGNMLNTTSPVNFSNPPAVLITLLAESMQQIASSGFILATGNLNFYVATTGSDNNPGTITQPFATIQRAVTAAAGFNYQNLYFPTVNVAAGTYTLSAIIILPSLFNVLLTNFPSGGRITGDPTTPSNVILDGGSASPPGHFVHPAAGTAWSITGFQLQNAATGTAVNVNNGAAILNLDSCNFVNNLRHFKAFAGGQIFTGFNHFKLSFQGDAHNISLATVAAQIIDFGCTWTFVGAQNYSVAVFQSGESATIDANFNAVVGANNITGPRYLVGQSGILQEIHFSDRSQFIGSTVGIVNKPENGQIQNDPFYNVYTPSSGGTVTTTPGEPVSILNPVGTLGTLTVNPPTNMSDAETWKLSSTQTITSLTLTTTDGSSIVGGPTTIPAHSGFTLMFDTAANIWYISD